MTQMGLDYLKYEEGKRSNLAKEKETFRSNLASETEANRSNMAREAETNRANLVAEAQRDVELDIRQQDVDEKVRSNKAHEAETNRHNYATEFETATHNRNVETETSLHNRQQEYHWQESRDLDGLKAYMSALPEASRAAVAYDLLSRKDKLSQDQLDYLWDLIRIEADLEVSGRMAGLVGKMIGFGKK